MAAQPRAVIARNAGTMKRGDVYALNDPYHGGGHLPDYNVFAPVHVDGKLVLVASIQCHHGDTGGGVPGSVRLQIVRYVQEHPRCIGNQIQLQLPDNVARAQIFLHIEP